MTKDHVTQPESDFQETLQEAVENVEEKVDEARRLLQKYNEQVVTLVTEKPVVAIAGAFAIGYVVGKFAAHRWFV